MLDGLTEFVPEILYTLLASALTIVGIVVESLAAQNLTGGETTMGLWLFFVGFVALYAANKVTHEKVLPAIR